MIGDNCDGVDMISRRGEGEVQGCGGLAINGTLNP